MSWSWHSLTSQERNFIRQFVEKLRLECKVIHHTHQELPYSIVQCMERRTQHNASSRTVNGRWRNWTTIFNPCLHKHPVKDVSVLRHGDDFATLATRTRIAEYKEDLSKHLLAKHIATLGPRPQLLDACELRFLNRVMRCVVPPFGKAAERIEIEADPKHSELLIKNSANKQQRSAHTKRAYERQFTHNQTFTRRCHIIPFHCHATRVVIS